MTKELTGLQTRPVSSFSVKDYNIEFQIEKFSPETVSEVPER